MFESLLATIAGALDRAGIPYMVIGGQAVLLYGEPRLTRDIDVTVGVDSSQLEALLDVVRDSGLTVAVKDLAGFVGTTNVVPTIDGATGIRVDFIFSFSEYESVALGRTNLVILGGTGVRFASVEDLLIHKIVAGRARDIEDIRGIMIRMPDIDQQYLRSWLVVLSRSLDRNLTSEWEKLST